MNWKKLRLVLCIVSVACICSLSVTAKIVNVNREYNAGETYVKIKPSVVVSENDYILYANTRPSKGDARLNITENGVSVATGNFPTQTARTPISKTMYIGKEYTVRVRAVSGTTKGVVNYYTNK